MRAGDPGRTSSGEPIPAGLARRIAADPSSTWYRLLTDEIGDILDLSTTSYRPTAPLWRAVMARDRQCFLPGCTECAELCDHEHTIPHPDGRTSYTNGGTAGRVCHQVKQTPGFVVHQPEPGRFEWTYPTGHRYTKRPRRHPVGRWPAAWQEPRSAAQMSNALDLLARYEQEQTRRQILRWRRDIDESRIRAWERAYADPDPPELDPAPNDDGDPAHDGDLEPDPLAHLPSQPAYADDLEEAPLLG